jgi:hypothetical protein
MKIRFVGIALIIIPFACQKENEESFSTWINYIGGTEKGETNWGRKFDDIMPTITYFHFNTNNKLILSTSDRKDQIIFDRAIR